MNIQKLISYSFLASLLLTTFVFVGCKQKKIYPSIVKPNDTVYSEKIVDSEKEQPQIEQEQVTPADLSVEEQIAQKYPELDVDHLDEVYPSIIRVVYTDSSGQERTQYYAEKLGEMLTINNMLRFHYKYHIRLIDPSIDLINVPITSFAITNKYLILNNSIRLNLEKFKGIFRPFTGLPCLYEGERLRTTYRPVDTTKKHVAFTFDDGPMNENHEKIRDLFDTYNQSATFCVVGRMVNAHPQMLLKTYLNGHQIVNHTYNHADLTKQSDEKRWADILHTSNAVLKITGYDMNYIRPPYGGLDPALRKEFHNCLCLWTVDTEDWKCRNKQIIISRVLSHIHDGAVVLFHDLYEPTYEAIAYLLPTLIQEGYQFVTYDQLERINAERRKQQKLGKTSRKIVTMGVKANGERVKPKKNDTLRERQRIDSIGKKKWVEDTIRSSHEKTFKKEHRIEKRDSVAEERHRSSKISTSKHHLQPDSVAAKLKSAYRHEKKKVKVATHKTIERVKQGVKLAEKKWLKITPIKKNLDAKEKERTKNITRVKNKTLKSPLKKKKSATKVVKKTPKEEKK